TELSTILASSPVVNGAIQIVKGSLAEVRTHPAVMEPEQFRGPQPGWPHRPAENTPHPTYQRSRAEPQVNPPPIASSRMRLPRLMRRSATASVSARGI